jgi:hypothetical protein
MTAEAQLIGIALNTAVVSTDGTAWLTGAQLTISTASPDRSCLCRKDLESVRI